MRSESCNITVYYDGACPKCIRDRRNYERLAGKAGGDICWFDITGREADLRQIGIDPRKALTELHVKDENDRVLSEMDAYILLMRRVRLLAPLAWLMGLRPVRTVLSKLYRGSVHRRLTQSGRL